MFYCGRNIHDYGYGTLLRDSDQVIVLCDTHTNLLSKHHPDVATEVRNDNPATLIKFSDNTDGQARARGRTGIRSFRNRHLLAYYGYIYPNKGIETLIKAVELAARHFPKIRLVLIGGTNEIVLKAANRPNYLQELKDFTEQLGITEKIFWTGYFPYDSEQPSVLIESRGHWHSAVRQWNFNASEHIFGVAASHDLPVISTRGKISKRNLLMAKCAALSAKGSAGPG